MSVKKTPAVLVFTDMDGTLLDHHSYDYQAAKPALARLKDLAVPVILNTSKTYSELQQWQQELGVATPFVVENGAAAYIPVAMLNVSHLEKFKAKHPALNIAKDNTHFVLSVSTPRVEILQLVHRLREQYGYQFRGFSDYSVTELCELTGLNPRDAEQALMRSFSEPICWDDSEPQWQVFLSQLKQAGLCVLRGGRFSHIMGRADKGRTMELVAELLYPEQAVITVALGDSGNDVAMLERASYAVIIRSPSHEPPKLVSPQGHVRLSEAYGPAGWNECMQDILDELNQVTCL